MLETKTVGLVNELIRGLTRFCIDAYKSGRVIDSEDLKALSQLVQAVNGRQCLRVETPDVKHTYNDVDIDKIIKKITEYLNQDTSGNA